jgi:hypothetical protein
MTRRKWGLVLVAGVGVIGGLAVRGWRIVQQN